MKTTQQEKYAPVFERGMREIYEASDGEAGAWDYVKGGLLELVDEDTLRFVSHSRELRVDVETRGYFDLLVRVLVDAYEEYEGYGNEWTLAETLVDTLHHYNALKEGS